MTQREDKLSPTAAYVFGSMFGYTAVLMYSMQEHVPSPEMQAVLDELVEAGQLIRETNMDDMPAHGEAVRYRRAPDSDIQRYRSDHSLGWLKKPETPIRVYIPKELRR